MIDAASGGLISRKTPEEVHELIEEMTANMYQYPMERSSKKAAGIYKLDSSTTTQAQLEALQHQFTNFQQQSNPVVASICGICGGGHADYECEGNVYALNFTPEQANFVRNSRRMDPYSNTYNPSWRNHPNFSWNNANQARQHPPGFKPLQTDAQQKDAGVEEDRKLLRTICAELQSLKTDFQSMKTKRTNIQQSITLLTTQVNQLNRDVYERPRGALPSNSEVNPNEQVKAITLRSGKTLEELQPKEQPAMGEEQNQKVKEEQRQEQEKVSSPASPRKKKGKDALPITDIDVRNLPYPSRAKTDILESSFASFLETFKNLQINIPLLEALKQMPLYGKFLKEVISRKRKMEEQGTVLLNENCSAILKNELPTKLKDPGRFRIPCEIGSNKFANALCDLGASVNLMPLSLCRYLKLGEPQEIGLTLQFADRSTKIEGVMEDVLVKIQDFIYPCDFVVLDMEVDKNLPIILGRPFLATTGAIIDCKQGNLTLKLNNDTISFNIKEAMKQPAIPHDDFCLSIDVIDSCIAEIEEEARIGEAKEGGLVNSKEKEDEDPIMTREVDELEAERKEEGRKEQGAQGASKPELKPFHNNLKYVFLEENDKPVIISSCLTGLEEKMLIDVLSKHKKAMGWSLSDIEGINPTFCTHRILMEDNYKPNIQPQRRLNPTLQEVVKKEVIKLLDAGIIYPISDSAWQMGTKALHIPAKEETDSRFKVLLLGGSIPVQIKRFMTRSQVEPPQEIDPKPERTLRQRLKENQNQSTPKDHEDMENVEGTRRTPFRGMGEVQWTSQKMPNHKIELWSQIEVFYNGLNINTRSMIDAASGGSISKMTPEEVHELLEEMTANMYQYPLERSSKKAAGVFKLDSSTSVQSQLDALQQQIASLQKKPTHVVASICELRGGGHADYECQGNVYALNSTPEQANFVGNSRRMDPISNTYNPGWKNHPNFSWIIC
ncbi:hypothetical protein H6P81_009953 [Aristolochia fimbriata]|uniref:Retrotransposon gag protein n=1 Tax=Aristolochia fimbriata TaxID=158543 RepID=A0AAV7ERU2_ARIFI|nr:hypothetical protein H6P81_009953 [Aristolochia fimbriata]